MAVQSTLKGGDRVPAASPAQIPCCLGTCPGGTIGQAYTFDPGSDVIGTLRGGKLSQLVLYLHATSGSRVVVVPTTGTYPALPSLTATGSGPAVSLGLTAGNALGAYDDVNLALAITGAGALGAATATLCYDGFNVDETFTLPAEGPAVLRGKTDLILGADLEALTLVFTAPSATTITFATGTLPGAAAGLHAATSTTVAVQTLLTAALVAGGVAALLAHPRRISFTTAGGTAADAPANALVTGTDPYGAAQTETITVAQTATISTGVKLFKTITSIVYAAGDGTGGTVAVGYDDAQTDADEVAAAFNTLAIAAPLAVRARVPDVASGAKYLELYTTGVGTGTVLTIDDATSTADVELGFTSVSPSNLTAPGSAATRDLPYLGITLTFPSGSYLTSHSYAAAVLGPRSSVAALQAGAIVAHDGYAQRPFGLLVATEDFSTMANASAALTALSGLVNTWAADPAAPIFVRALVGSALHTPSAVKATNDANIGIADAAFLAAFPNTSVDAVLDNVAVGDVYIRGASPMPKAKYRRPASWCGAAKVAGAARFAANPADGLVFGASLLGPDEITRARDENGATTKLGGLDGPGAWVLKGTSGGLIAPAFELCASRARASSRLREVGAVAAGREIERVTFIEVEAWAGQGWEGQAANPIAADASETQPREDHLHDVLRELLQPDVGPANVTNFDVVVTAPDLGNTGKAYVAVTYNPLNVVGTVVVAVAATGAAITSAG